MGPLREEEDFKMSAKLSTSKGVRIIRFAACAYLVANPPLGI